MTNVFIVESENGAISMNPKRIGLANATSRTMITLNFLTWTDPKKRKENCSGICEVTS